MSTQNNTETNEPKSEFNENLRSKPVRPLTDDKFTKHHLAMSKGEYDQVYHSKNGITNNDGLSMIEIIDPKAEDFLYYLHRVGNLYGWHLRKEFQETNKPYIEQVMAQEETRLYVFKKRVSEAQDNGEPPEDKTVGFCLMTAIPPLPEDVAKPVFEGEGANSLEAVDRFKMSRRLEANSRAIEINKIGLFDEYTGKGYGNFFLAKILDIQFNREGHNIVYLNTRDTNHAGVGKFYQKNGIDNFYSETLFNDLVDDAPEILAKPDLTDRSRHVNGGHPALALPRPDDQ